MHHKNCKVIIGKQIMTFLKTQRLYLQRLTKNDDFSEYLKMVNDPEIVDNVQGLGVKILTEDSLIEYVQRYDGQLLSIFSNDGKHIGNIGLSQISHVHRSCDFAIMMSQNARGKGYGKEASILALKYAFDNLNIHRVSLGVLTKNKAAIKLYEDIGFKREGKLRDYFFRGGQYRDVFTYSLLSTEAKF